ncbi:DNA methyltransferase [Psychromonas hadalis]|uniref:DNA methyltransferase n=1 Tax=Psychromonas hadalis TaxID=211669 RepID=UPI0003B518E7|nr:DNA methyltransferase [Psychromonas hadalis]
MSSTNGKTIPKELYPTPAVVVDALMKVITFREGDKFLEPCYGTGAIFNKVPLPRMTKSLAELAFGIDYLTTEFEQKDVIITNPPFSLTEQFLEKSLSELAPDGTLIYLQRLNYLGSKKRVPFWARIGFPHKTPVIVPRPRFVGGGSDSCEYAWFIWDFGSRVALPQGLSHLISEGK